MNRTIPLNPIRNRIPQQLEQAHYRESVEREGLSALFAPYHASLPTVPRQREGA